MQETEEIKALVPLNFNFTEVKEDTVPNNTAVKNSTEETKYHISKKASDFGRMSVIFKSRKLLYLIYSFLLITSSAVSLTIYIKLSSAGKDELYKPLFNLFDSIQYLNKSWFDALLLASPVLVTSLITYFGGYTIFSRFISSVWLILIGFVWGTAAPQIYNSLPILKSIIFSAVSATIFLICILFSAEASKYSDLTALGKKDLLKFKNIFQFTIIYFLFSSFIFSLSYVLIYFVLKS